MTGRQRVTPEEPTCGDCRHSSPHPGSTDAECRARGIVVQTDELVTDSKVGDEEDGVRCPAFEARPSDTREPIVVLARRAQRLADELVGRALVGDQDAMVEVASRAAVTMFRVMVQLGCDLDEVGAEVLDRVDEGGDP